MDLVITSEYLVIQHYNFLISSHDLVWFEYLGENISRLLVWITYVIVNKLFIFLNNIWCWVESGMCYKLNVWHTSIYPQTSRIWVSVIWEGRSHANGITVDGLFLYVCNLFRHFLENQAFIRRILLTCTQTFCEHVRAYDKNNRLLTKSTHVDWNYSGVYKTKTNWILIFWYEPTSCLLFGSVCKK